MNYPFDLLKPDKRVVIPMRADDEGCLVPFYNMAMLFPALTGNLCVTPHLCGEMD